MSFYSDKVLELYEDSNIEFILEIGDITTGGNRLNMNGNSIPCKIKVEGGEGDYVPHFHFIFRKHGKQIDGCIKIMSAEYFIHGHHTGTLNNKEAQVLNYWLTLPSADDNQSYKSNWLRIVGEWNKAKENKYRLPDPEDLSPSNQPNYAMLNC